MTTTKKKSGIEITTLYSVEIGRNRFNNISKPKLISDIKKFKKDLSVRRESLERTANEFDSQIKQCNEALKELK